MLGVVSLDTILTQTFINYEQHTHTYLSSRLEYLEYKKPFITCSLPDAFAISLGVKSRLEGRCLREALVGRKEGDCEDVKPGHHAYDGSYTSLELKWHDVHIQVETGVENDEWYAQITRLNSPKENPYLTIEAGVLWAREGYSKKNNDSLTILNDEKEVNIYTLGGKTINEPVVEISSPFILLEMNEVISVSTDKNNIANAGEIIQKQKEIFLSSRNRDEKQQELYDAMQICLAWDTIYDPFYDRIISPVSRVWSCNHGGWVLFDWDTYFASWMAALENKELAYANAIAITDCVTEKGFIPCMTRANGLITQDRSQPPVGSLCVRAICEMHNETVLAEKLFDTLLGWNRWWPENRDTDGYLCWGSTPYEAKFDHTLESIVCNTRFAAQLESGLDNSPMYRGMPYSKEKNMMEFADVGLMSFYITDCRELALIAKSIGRNEVVEELDKRADFYSEKLKTLWCDETGLFLNKRLDNNELQHRLSPTHFYPLLAEVATQEQAERMMEEHFFNPEEFWGDYILPAISRNDECYPDQDYWAGRIWAPMNFLVYLGIRKYNLPKAQKAIVEKSEDLLLKEWREHGHVHENYCGDTGYGCGSGKQNSDAFYHWGGLLALISVLDNNN